MRTNATEILYSTRTYKQFNNRANSVKLENYNIL